MPEKMVNGNLRKNLTHKKKQIIGLKHIKCINTHHMFVKSVGAGIQELKIKNHNYEII